ncbi:MAG: amidohydrolase [Steroidobacteraceae bacterium]|nr:amidohydrolase [Steroidobacteraceae bacterium]
MIQSLRPKLFVPIALLAAAPGVAAVDDAAIEAATTSVVPQVVTWRRDFHQNPELSNREVRTSRIVAEALRKMGLQVRTGIAHTGVVAVLEGGRPGPTIALRADMDALPVTEQVDVPFKSVATAEYRGEKVGVMHACGHDAHTAILLGTARVLAGMREQLPGVVMFVFQPAEEGAPEGERGGAKLMIDEGLFATTKPEAMFGLHVFSTLNAGHVGYRTGPLMAASDSFRIVVTGRQTHGARPWGGVDPIVTASQIVMALQTIVARQVDITQYPAIVSVGAIKGGIRNNIIPDSVEMVGTFRTFDPKVREQVIERIKRIATDTATAAGATATFALGPDPNPVVVNEAALTQRAVATLERVAGKDHVELMPYLTVSEDFAYYGQQVPSFFYFVGSTPQGQDAVTAPSNHSPKFFLDEGALPLGVRTLTALALDYLQGKQ